MYVMNRAMLLEMFFRFAIYLFTNHQVMRGGKGQKKVTLVDASSKKKTEEEKTKEGYEELSFSQAFYLFIETRLKPYHDKM